MEEFDLLERLVRRSEPENVRCRCEKNAVKDGQAKHSSFSHLNE